MSTKRADGRSFNQLRTLKITPGFSKHAEGSALIEMGDTRVLCTASVEQTIPKWLQGGGKGWVTAEYGMLPRSTHTRISREKANNSGRSQEISRLIARSLRAAVDLKALGERSISVDCDVIQADGGTRTAAITGGFVALTLAIAKLKLAGLVPASSNIITQYVSAISVGLKEGNALLDLNYDEDSSIGTDMNIVMTADGRFVELQGTAETTAFSREELDQVLTVAADGCRDLFRAQASITEPFVALRLGY
ncbi:MAG: ribonuclease PH [Bdellovibrionales bacterium]|jgi:ribonuclease PH|nr:ribonuclease PH [Bdellovibrionales bacterium]